MAQAPTDLVRAAGADIVRDGAVAVVHRPRYDGWTLPSEPGEDDRSAAMREVWERPATPDRSNATWARSST
jgi:hypothetical protein